MAFNFEDILKGITSELKSLASTKTVVGEPIDIAGKTIIPVIKIKMGFGAGAGEDVSGERKHGHGGAGGGGGGGVNIEPAAFITIIGDEISVLSPKGSKFEKIAEAVPDIVAKIMAAQAKKEEVASGDEEETPA